MGQLTLALALCALAHSADTAAAPGVLAGAIRWDAWFGRSVPLPAGAPGWAVAKALSPAQFHDRLPFFATVSNASSADFNNNVQDVIDAEISYAVAAGLDHFAFVSYPLDNVMSASLALYRKSTAPAKARLRWARVLQGSWEAGDGPAAWPAKASQYAQEFAAPDYVRVTAGGISQRPLLYLFDVSPSQWGPPGGNWSTWGWALQLLANLTAQQQQPVPLGPPYVVLMSFNASYGAYSASQMNPGGGAPALVSALSSYAIIGGAPPPTGAPYEQLVNDTRSFWEQCVDTGMDVVPVVPAGWDRSPRVLNPPPWESNCTPPAPCSWFYQMPRPEQLGNLTEDALAFLERQKESRQGRTASTKTASAAPRAVGPSAATASADVDSPPIATDTDTPSLLLLSAWNEFDEGHYVAPIRAPGTGAVDNSRLEAIAAALAGSCR